MIQWSYFPLVNKPTELSLEIIRIFEKHVNEIDSEKYVKQESDIVLSKLRKSLKKIGFQVEEGKKKDQKIIVPVLFGRWNEREMDTYKGLCEQ